MDSSKKQRKPKKRARADSKQNDLFDSLPWNQSLSSKDGAFSFLIGSNELEGGFLSLEEIDEKEYGLDIPKPKMESEKESTVKEVSKLKKGKSTLALEVESPNGEEQEEKGEGEVTESKRKKRKREKYKKKLNDILENETDGQTKGDHVEGEVSEVKKKKRQGRKRNKNKLKENESDSQNKGEHGEGEVTEASKKEEQTDSQNRGEHVEGEVTEVSEKEQTDSQNEGEHVKGEVSEVKKKKKRQRRNRNKNKLKEGLENASDSQTKGEHGEGEVTELCNKEQTDSQNKGEHRKGEDMEAKEKKKKPRKKKPSKKEENSKNVTKEHVVPASDIKEDVEGEILDETEYYAWNELRLHPQLMKSIYQLKFKEPTPIQKACIPAAAHQGKDVIGAAETGSGKTLAFGLPIVQRLLEERDKVENLIDESDEAHERITARGFLRALIITPTRELAMQVTDHIKQVTRDTNIRVVPIVGGMSTQKQERLLKSRPEIVVGTPGRLWELMSGGSIHLMELHSLSFFVLDEADRMVESGHFRELQSIIDMLPMTSGSVEGESENTENCATVSSFQRKKRQTFVFSATIALSADFRKKLKKGSKSKQTNGLSSIETLSERAGMRENAAIFDLTNASIMAHNLEESFIECKEEDKDAYLYYILSVHGRGRAIIFCTSIAALRHMSSILRILDINVWTLHAQMQQRARLKSIDRFRENEHGVLVATDVAARGIDIPGIRTVIHYQLPHSAEVYVHRSGRTARASSDGCSIALISPNETSKFAGLCKSFAKESFQRFPTDISYMPEVMKRISLARQIDKILRKDSQDKAKKTWLEKNAESVELFLEDNDSEDERVNKHKQNKATSAQLKKLQGELKGHLSRPLQPKTFSNRYLAGAGVSPLLQKQFMEMARKKVDGVDNLGHNKRRNLVVIGQECVEPLEALRNAGQKSVQILKQVSDTRKKTENLKRKRKEEKKRLHEQRRKQRKKEKAGNQ